MRGAACRACLLSWLVLLVAAAAGCSTIRDGGEACSAGASALPSGSLQDYVTYGDLLVEWQVDGETRVPPTPEESASGDRTTITRLVQARTSLVLWRRPTAPDRLSAPPTLDVASGGWEVHGRKERPIEGVSPRLEVGRRYLAVLSLTDLSATSARPDGVEWIALEHFALDDRGVVVQSAGACRSAEVDRVVAGKTAAEVARLLAATPVDPAAEPYLDLDPVVRFQRAADDERATSSYTPGPGPGEKE